MLVGQAHGATAATDVTGFGLLGHLRNLCRGSKLSATIELATLPILPDALTHLAANRCPGGSKANRAFVAGLVAWQDGRPLAAEPGTGDVELRATLACDAQTSGGLLLCVPEARAAACVAALRDLGLPAARVGTLDEVGPTPITLVA
jgi:selenide,water dikinase